MRISRTRIRIDYSLLSHFPRSYVRQRHKTVNQGWQMFPDSFEFPGFIIPWLYDLCVVIEKLVATTKLRPCGRRQHRSKDLLVSSSPIEVLWERKEKREGKAGGECHRRVTYESSDVYLGESKVGCFRCISSTPSNRRASSPSRFVLGRAGKQFSPITIRLHHDMWMGLLRESSEQCEITMEMWKWQRYMRDM